MKIIKTIKEMRRWVRLQKRKGLKIGFVPTMGALHAGHESLLKYSVKSNDVTVLSIYVNPTQFGPGEDFKSYPRRLSQDMVLAKNAGAAVLFSPSHHEMYPQGFLTSVEVRGLDKHLCGADRPGHFRGVTTVVMKLLNIVTPRIVYLGQKDLQQAVIIQKMVSDLNVDVDVVVCPTIREKDGVALSSRNQYLSDKHRAQAVMLYKALLLARHMVSEGKVKTAYIKKRIKQLIAKNTDGKIDYVDVGDLSSMSPVSVINQDVFVALAVRFGRARLIDNIIIKYNAKKNREKD